MTVAAACFKWASVLETQFDKSWVELDSLLQQLEEDEDFAFLYGQARRPASSLASCFSQLAHKATVVFQNNAKLEAELVHLRAELGRTRELAGQLQRDKQYLTRTLQASLAANHRLRVDRQKEETDKKEGSEINVNNGETAQEKMTNSDVEEKEDSREPFVAEQSFVDNGSEQVEVTPPAEAQPEGESARLLEGENTMLREEVLELQSELVGARLDNVYLDKELAGRIQQIQLLLATNTPSQVKERMWGQIESEMCLQRSKTIATMCRRKQEARLGGAGVEPRPASPASTHSQEQENTGGKQVMILKNPADDLGIAILGGREHGLPVIISEIFPGSAVHRASRVRAGDILARVNGEDFSRLTHQEAVTFLSSLRGQIILELVGAEKCREDDPSNLDYRFYKIFDSALAAGSTAGVESRSSSHPGHAVSCTSLETVDTDTTNSVDLVPKSAPADEISSGSPGSAAVRGLPELPKELPEVHVSPKK